MPRSLNLLRTPTPYTIGARRFRFLVAMRCGNRVANWAFVYALLLVCLLGCVFLSGCASAKWVELRKTPRNPLSAQLSLLSRGGPKPTERTLQLLRRYDLESQLEADRPALLAKLSTINHQEPNREILYAMAELAYIAAKTTDSDKQGKSLELYGTAVMRSYEYLFDDTYLSNSNPYDPQFRRACDLYNASLEGMLRLISKQGNLRPGKEAIVQTANRRCRLRVNFMSDGWKAEDFDRFEFASDYQINGLRNHYRTFGLGVPLIAISEHTKSDDPREKFYPEKLSYPLTAIIRIDMPKSEAWPAVNRPQELGPDGKPTGKRQSEVLEAVLELHDPLMQQTFLVEQTKVPLETDISTPLAYFLSQPEFSDEKLSTQGLLMPERAQKVSGLYMLEPFDPEKIPVVMVHGLWSSPVTWMEMFNDLRSDPTIREHYQFWFCLYPSGQPFWYSAAQIRENLVQARNTFDPMKQHHALDQTVLVGHSMGGLVSKMQTVYSEKQFWETVSERPFTELEADAETRNTLGHTFFFQPNPSVRRVITIGTPFQGSHFANDFTRWLGRKAISLPTRMMQGQQKVFAQNPNYFKSGNPLEVTTSIASLSPSSAMLDRLQQAEQGRWIRQHNIVGNIPNKGVVGTINGWFGERGDGVVALTSSKLENIASQIVVPADHTSIHRDPKSILEVRRILYEHLAQLKAGPTVLQAARNAKAKTATATE